MIGNPGTTTVEQITQMSLWCIAKAPLIISTDLRNASNTTIEILTNAQAIAVNQDSLGVPGKLVQRTEAGGQVWTGELSGGRYAAVLVNMLNTTDQLVALDWSLLPGMVAATTPFLVNDVWNNTGGDLGQHVGSISLNVPPHGSRMIVLRPASSPSQLSPPPPAPAMLPSKSDDDVAAGARLESASCTTDLQCNLNGVCSATTSMCICDKPWSGPTCGSMRYLTTNASAKDIYNSTADAEYVPNTWGGPIVGPESDGLYHAFVPHYAPGTLFGAKTLLHGTAEVITGPYSWTAMKGIAGGINPAFLKYPNASSSSNDSMVYSIWLKGKIHVADSAAGPFRLLEGVTYPDAPNANPAPIYHNGAFYVTTQHTTTIWSRPTLLPSPDRPESESDRDDPEAGWEVFATISQEDVPAGVTPEDPFMWIDSRNNWHIINHAYDTNQTTECARSALSTHFFSKDGKDWQCSDVEPYGHTIAWSDGTNHTYTTLERPNLHFDSATGRMTYLVLAADLVTGDEGCASRQWPRKGPGPYGPTACTNCKYKDHCGTVVVKLLADGV